MGRLDAIRPAERPKLFGRALLSGPSGAGKTWTSLSIARVLADGDMSKVLVIDTERESALTYADVFVGFSHLPWRAPYDPGELTETLRSLANSGFLVIIIDSLSHFWRKQGGTLSIADGNFRGWKGARPVQDALVEELLSVPAHVLLCVRSKMDYLVSQDAKGKQEITKVGLAPIQDDDLVYEMNVAMDLTLEHNLTVTKSRCPAVPVGRLYPAGHEGKAAEDYAEWLAGGIPPASKGEIANVLGLFTGISDDDVRKALKGAFVERFGMPDSLTSAQVAEATAWLEGRLNSIVAPVEPPAAEAVPA